MSFPDDDFDENKDVLSQHASMLSVEIANRIHPSLDFFEGHLEEVKEYALLTIAQLEEVKMFLKRVKKKKSTSNKRERLFSEKKKKSKEQQQQQQQQQSFGVEDDDDENENDETSDDDVLRRDMRNRMEIDLSKLTARLEQDFAFIDSARETLNVIERKVSEMEEDVWEKEKATVKTRVDQKVEQVKDQFGRMFSSMFSSNKSSSS
ncbi:unnamed protein product [Bathycoccus prasinos]|jgi:hypothetical protein|tara:strand:+ start:6721 stop:7338 length:618 start_codon:yes stop_codon:yes gene_type:complete